MWERVRLQGGGGDRMGLLVHAGCVPSSVVGCVWWAGWVRFCCLVFLVVSVLSLGLAYLGCVGVGCHAGIIGVLGILCIGCSGVCWSFPVPVCCLCLCG